MIDKQQLNVVHVSAFIQYWNSRYEEVRKNDNVL